MDAPLAIDVAVRGTDLTNGLWPAEFLSVPSLITLVHGIDQIIFN
jgi:hypothetical protein